MVSDGNQGKTVELAVVVPIFNEALNVRPLYDSIDKVLNGNNISFEVIYVDDNSPDNTSDVIRALSRERANVRCLQRIGRRGLSSATIEGMLSTAAPYIAVMDADMQHDETILPSMLDLLRNDKADVVIGSRYVAGGGVGDWNANRARASAFATRLALGITRVEVKDPMSGFFVVGAPLWRSLVPSMSTIGFKVLLDLLASSPKPLRVVEVPYEFRSRQFGESKLDSAALYEYALLLLDKRVGRYVSVRFLSFCAIGLIGLGIHLLVLGVTGAAGASFVLAHSIGSLAAMTSNFVLNNWLTYRDKRIKGLDLIRGWLTFCLISSVGLFANVGVGAIVHESEPNWALSAIPGIALGVIWNYVATRVFTWRA